jgi:DNA recombination protein RmuC
MSLTGINFLEILAGAVLGVLVTVAWLLPRLWSAQVLAKSLSAERDAANAAVDEGKTQLRECQDERDRHAVEAKDLAGEKVLRQKVESDNESLTKDLAAARADATRFGRESATANEKIRGLNARIDEESAHRHRLESEVEALRTERDTALLAASNAKKDVETANTLHQQTKEFLDTAGTHLRDQFQSLSAQVLDQRGKALGEQHVERLDAIVKPLAAHLAQLEEKIATVEKSRAEDRGSLVTMIGNLADAQTMLQTEASELAKSLRGNVKARGNWGEQILDKVLEASGLIEGVHYHKQVSNLDEDEGRRLQPDVVLALPNGRSVVIDSKTPLDAHTRYVNAEDEATAAQALTDHVAAIRTHVKDLSSKNYAKAYGPSGLDIVLMFVPIEGALAVAIHDRPELQTDALAKKVALVSPMTLHVALHTVEYLWRTEKLSKSMDEIIKRGKLLYDEAVRLGEELENLDSSLTGSRKAFDVLKGRLADPSRGVIRRAQELYKLGVAKDSRKTMPGKLAMAVDAGDELTQADTIAMGVDGVVSDGADAGAASAPTTDGV